jgi:hypothetical protein
MIAEEQIEEILIDASRYGLRIEVLETAQKYIKEGYDKITSYEMSYQEWIK